MLRKGSVIYHPTGRAAEYHDLAFNLYRGCGHGCVYCYAPDATYIEREEFQKATPRKNIIDRLQKDAYQAAREGITGNVLLCFTCDPYQPIDDLYRLTRQAIEILHGNGFGVTILTKSSRAWRDFELYMPSDEFATTLTFLDEKKSLEWEPEAALPCGRIDNLKIAHDLGIKTWVSLEPVIEPAQSLEIIRQTHTFVDIFKVGKLNYVEKLPEPFRRQVQGINWRQFATDVIAVLKQYGCQYYIKQDLRSYL